MRKNLFWLSDEQWKRIESHLPTDVRGVDRVDDRTANGVRTAMLISKAVLRTLAAADATFREVTEAKRAGKQRPE
jgi:transposase